VSICLFDIDSGKVFSDTDIRLVETVASAMSVALENARLFDETQRLLRETEQRNAELAIINSVQEGLARRLDMQAIYELVGEKIRETFDTQIVNIATYDRATNMIQGRYFFEAGRVLPGITLPAFGFRKYVIENQEPLVVNENMSHWMEVYDNPVLQGVQPKSALFVPMIVGAEAIGVISLQNINQENAFTEADLRLLTTLANSMSVALENARLWEQERLYRKALERELEIGREIQAGFLPEALPQVEGWEIAAALMSAREVAGDFYDAFELADGNFGLVIADVCDKGVGAALFMTLFRSLVRVTSNLEHIEHTGLPHSTPERLKRAMALTNNYIAETHGESGMFATLFFGILDPRDGKLTYINGGHEPPLILRSGLVRETLRKTGPAVGAIPNGCFELQETHLFKGDTFFAFTDGAPDSRDPRGEFYGRERLLEILHRSNGSAHELVSSLEAELRQYIGGGNQFDDITLLAVRRLGI
jgi:sigma-B regulation protein RsbU (phosphoserine phosphatase)